MKIKNIIFIYILSFLFLNLSSHIKAESNVDKYPYVYTPTDNYEFNTIIEGDEIEHSFIIQNKGTAFLNIEKVEPG